MKVIKRDGRIVEYDSEKISIAIQKANKEVKGEQKASLDDIKGIGPARRKELMRYFKGIEDLRNAGVDELAQVPRMNAAAAQAVYDHFHKEGELNG